MGESVCDSIGAGAEEKCFHFDVGKESVYNKIMR